MLLTLLHLLNARLFPDNEPLNQEDIDSYCKAHEQLTSIISESENIWEDRTYQIAAGGLSISFAVFSFCFKSTNKLDWQIVLIWGLYAICLIINYLSHLISIHKARKMQNLLRSFRAEKKPYNEEFLNSIYSKEDRLTKNTNLVLALVLSCTVVYTLVYSCLIILNYETN